MVRQVGFVQRDVQREHSAGVQMALHRFEVLFRIQRGGSFHEYIQRIGGDDVELFVRGQQVMPRVIEDDAWFSD